MANGFIIPTDLVLNIGTYANDGTGDDIRTAFQKIKSTFTLINTNLSVTTGENIGASGQGIFSEKVDNKLQFKKITGTNGIVVSSTATTVNLAATNSVELDVSPRLGGNLNLNNHNIIGVGDVQTTVYGLDIRTMNALLQLLNSTNNYVDLDLGSFTNPNQSQFDLGTF
jgi:hypothetical protein